MAMAAVAAGLTLASAALAQTASDRLVVQLNAASGVAVAGYHAAAAQGFFAAEGLQVDLLAPQEDAGPLDALARGTADVVVTSLPEVLMARDRGLSAVMVAPPVTTPPVQLICRRDAGVADPRRDLAGRTIGVRSTSDQIVLRVWLANAGVQIGNAPGAVRLTAADRGALASGQTACITGTAVETLPLLAASGLGPDALSVTALDGPAGPLAGDGVTTLEARLADPAATVAVDRFVRAARRGWDWALANPDAAAALPAVRGREDAEPLAAGLRSLGAARQADDAGPVPAAEATAQALASPATGPLLSRLADGGWIKSPVPGAGR